MLSHPEGRLDVLSSIVLAPVLQSSFRHGKSLALCFNALLEVVLQRRAFQVQLDP